MTCASISVEAAVRATWDAIILGAGPSGTIAAREIAAAGARVLIVEKKAFPRPKVCGACLSGRALDLLNGLGLGALPRRLGAIPLDTFALSVRGRSTRLSLPGGVALSRASLDMALAEAAVDAGAVFLPSVTASVEPVRGDVRPVRLCGHGPVVEATARVVLVAAGLGNACLVREPATRTIVAARSRIGAGCTVPAAGLDFAEGTIFMAVSRAGYVGLVRVEDGRLNVAAALDPSVVKSAGIAAAAAAVVEETDFPPLPELAAAHWAGTPALTRRARSLATSRLFVLGDAAGYVEPFTGEGIAWAIAAGAEVAPLALRACDSWTPDLAQQWTTRYRERIGRSQVVCRSLARLLRYPALAGAAVALVDRAPALAQPLLRRHTVCPASLEATAR